MNVTDFFQLPQEQRDKLTAIHVKQKYIRKTSENIKKQFEALNIQYKANQEDCFHPFVKKTHHRSEDYGCAPAFTTNFYCPDCDKHWHEEGSK